MLPTWTFRALFVPLLVLAIITSNFGGVEAVDAAASKLVAVMCMLVDDPCTFAARLCCQWRDASTPGTSTRAYRGCDLLLEYL